MPGWLAARPFFSSEPHTIHSKARHDGQRQPSNTMSVLVLINVHCIRWGSDAQY